MKSTPPALKSWFIIHFVIDTIFAIPLFFAPETILTVLGWKSIDPIATRLVAAALFGIGIESYVSRNSTIENFNQMLNLKIIWSATATIGILISQIELTQNAPIFGWWIFGIFGIFHLIWVYWRIKIKT